MGEKKLREWVKFKDLIDHFGYSESFFYKHAKELEPALLKINGRAPKPHKFDLEIVSQILKADGSQTEKPARQRPERSLRTRTHGRPESATSSDDDLGLKRRR